MIDFPTAKHKFSFFLDRKNQKVTIDINSASKMYSKHFDSDALGEDTIRSLALVFQGNTVALFLDCKKIGVQDLEVNMNQLYAEMDDPVLKLVSRGLLTNECIFVTILYCTLSSARENIRCTLITTLQMRYSGPIVKSPTTGRTTSGRQSPHLWVWKWRIKLANSKLWVQRRIVNETSVIGRGGTTVDLGRSRTMLQVERPLCPAVETFQLFTETAMVSD